MNCNKIYIWVIAGLGMCLTACDKEEVLVPSDEIGIKENFEPNESAPQIVKDIYKEYGVWVRMEFEDAAEVGNAMLDNDPYLRGNVEKIEDEYQASAYQYIETLLGNVPGEFAQKHFPLDFFIVKSYGMQPWWGEDFRSFGRSRFLMTWPNKYYGTIDVNLDDYEFHYYQDTVLTSSVWGHLAKISSLRMKPVDEIQSAGMAYNDEAYAKIIEQYKTMSERRAAWDELAREGGFVTGLGSKSFEQDIADWIQLLAVNSYDEIKAGYLDNSPNRAAKYIEVVKFMNSLGWDIQATGNKYSQMKKEHKL